MTWIGSIRIRMENNQVGGVAVGQAAAAAADNIPADDFLRPLHDDWFGETSAPLIFRAINLESWDICRRLLAENDASAIQSELQHIDMYGYSALHYACWWRSAPMDIVTQLVEHSPAEYPAQRNRKGRTPLHLAAWRGRDEVVQLLARKCPQAASVMDKNEKSPLSDACSRNRSKQVLEALIQADPSQISKRNCQERTPAHTFFRISHGSVTKPSRTRFSNIDEQRRYGEKVRLILSTERTVQGKTKLNLDDDLELLRAAIESSSCSIAYTKYLLDQVVDGTEIGDYRDENGNTLLHIVLHADSFEFETFYKCDRCSGHLDKMYFNRDPDRAHWGVRCTKCSGQRQTVMMHYVQVPVVNKHATIIDSLLCRHPNLARIRDASGRLPLEIALQNGFGWYTGAYELVKAFPESLSTPETRSGLFPFLLAATSDLGEEDDINNNNDGDDKNNSNSIMEPPIKRRKKNDGSSFKMISQPKKVVVDTVFQLLRECPDLIKMAID